MTGRRRLVVGRAGETEALAAVLALEDSGTPVVHLRDGEPSPLVTLVPARRGARELVARLSAAGIVTVARGALAVVDAAGEEPLALVERVESACGRAPVVALLRPRLPEDERLLEHCELVVAEGARGAALDLLGAEMDRRRVPVQRLAAPAGLAAAMARSGVRLPAFGASPGQASVEMLALLPLLLTATLACGQLLAAGHADEIARHASTAGAAALLQGRDAAQAARRALPGWARGRATVRVDGRRVSVRIVPRGPRPLARLLEAHGGADAGPQP